MLTITEVSRASLEMSQIARTQSKDFNDRAESELLSIDTIRISVIDSHAGQSDMMKSEDFQKNVSIENPEEQYEPKMQRKTIAAMMYD